MKPYGLGQLFALPLQSAVRAQNLALQETISFIEQFGLEQGATRNFRFTTERLVEERKVDPETGAVETQFKVEPLEVSIPLLALVQPPNMQLQEMNVEFGVEVVEPKTESIKSAAIPSAVLGSSLSPSLALFTSLGQSNPTTMKVNMKIIREIPEGMARVIDTLSDLLSGVPKKTEGAAKPPTPTTEEEPGTRPTLTTEKEPKTRPTPVITVEPVVRPATPTIEEVAGIDTEAVTILKNKGILTTTDFLSATETTESRKELKKTTGISLRRIDSLRRKARLLGER